MTGTLLVRADASPTSGMGHLLRTLALAQAWQDGGGTVVYATIDPPDRARLRLEREGIEVLSGDTAAGGARDLAWTLGIAMERAACVVVDGYHLGVPFANALADAGVKTLLVDDMGSPAPIRAMVLNQNLHGTRSIYPLAGGVVLVGTQYSMLRRELLQMARPALQAPPQEAPPHQAPSLRARARRALVTFGGADPQRLTEAAARALLDAGLERVVAVVGPAAPAAGLSHPQIDLYVDPPDFFALAASTDLAVVAAGSTVWEFAWLGVPMALVSTAANQEPTLAAAVHAGIAIGLGGAEAFRLTPPVARLAELAGDATLRATLTSKGRALIDGRGAARVAHTLATGREPDPATPASAPRAG